MSPVSSVFAPSDQPSNELDEFDREFARTQSAQKAIDTSPLEDFDKDFASRNAPGGVSKTYGPLGVWSTPREDRDPWPGAQTIGDLLPDSVHNSAKGFLSGIVQTPAKIAGGIYDIPSHLGTGEESGTGESLLKRIGVNTPENASAAERYGNIAGSLAGQAGIGLAAGAGVLPAIANVIGGQAGEQAGGGIARTLGASPAWQARAEFLGSTLGGIGAGRVGERIGAGPSGPNATQLHDAAQGIYNEIRGNRIDLHPDAMRGLHAQIMDLDELGEGSEITSPKTVGLVNKIKPGDADQSVAFQKLWKIRQKLGKLSVGNDDVERTTAGAAKARITQFINELPDNPGQVVGGQDMDAVGALPDRLAEADANWAGYKQLNTFNKAVARGVQKSGSTYTGGNLNNQLRQQFAGLADPNFPQRMSGWPQEAQDLVRQVASGGGRMSAENIARLVARMAPDNAIGLLTQLGGIGSSLVAANPALLGMFVGSGAAGLAARGAARAMQRSKLRALRSAISSNTPLAQKMQMPGGGEGLAEAEESGAGALAQEYLPEAFHHGAAAGADITGVGNPEQRKKGDVGGYSGLANRLHFATNMAMGRMKAKGGYDQPTENFADPEALRLAMARQAARPGIGGYGGSPGAPMGQGGYHRLAGNVPMSRGGYDGVTGFLDRLAAPIVAEHQQPWTPQRAMGVLGQALGMAGPLEGLGSGGGAGEALAVPSLTNAIKPTQYGAGRSPQITTPQYSTQKGNRLPTVNVPWPKVGGYDGEPSIGEQAMTEVAINRAAGTTPRGILQSVLSPTAQGIGQNIGMAMSPIEAYHGSPYDFNAFDSSKIGAGEGAQNEGHGLYFAENPNVAKSHKPTAGKMYQVEIGSEPEHFLDWDTPLTEQSGHVQSALRKLDPTWQSAAIKNNPHSTGKDLYDVISTDLGARRQLTDPVLQKYYPSGYNDDAAASDVMHQAGLPGIRYLEQESRGAGKGTHNYVIFDPSIIKIMRKYGILGPVSLAGASGAARKRQNGGYNDASGGGTVQDSTTMFGGYRSRRGWGARRGGYSVSPLAGGTSF